LYGSTLLLFLPFRLEFEIFRNAVVEITVGKYFYIETIPEIKIPQKALDSIDLIMSIWTIL